MHGHLAVVEREDVFDQWYRAMYNGSTNHDERQNMGKWSIEVQCEPEDDDVTRALLEHYTKGFVCAMDMDRHYGFSAVVTLDTPITGTLRLAEYECERTMPTTKGHHDVSNV
jgi:hypothetical protein